jgi:hypothetical protein
VQTKHWPGGKGLSNAMPAQRDRTQPSGGQVAAALARRVGDAVSSGVNGKGNGQGNGKIDTPSAREIALDVCSAILAEAHAGTAEHSSDVVLITEAIGERMGLAGEDAGDMLAAARLHDIGKVWVPSRILEKPGSLTEREWEVMRRHTVVGEEILSSVPELEEVGRLVRHSHERWDGGGYPDGLRSTQIPLGSRIIFCADAFHAIRCDRPYRAGRSAGEAVAEIKRCAGTQFDPQVAEALEEVVRERNSRPRAMGGSSRLFALLMCLVIGGAGTALARSDLLSEPGGSPPQTSAPKPPPACGTAACPSVAGPVGGLGPVGLPGPRVLHPGLPGLLHGGVAGGNGIKGGSEKDKGNNGKSEAAKAKQDSHGKAVGHSHESQSGGQSSSSGSSAAPSSSSSTQSGGHHSSGGNHSSSGHHSGGSRGSSGGSHGHGGSTNSAAHGNSGSGGESSASHGE